MLAPSIFEHNIMNVIVSQEKDQDWESEAEGKTKSSKVSALGELINGSIAASLRSRREDRQKTIGEMAARMMSAYQGPQKDDFVEEEQVSSTFSRQAEFTQAKSSTAEVVSETGVVSEIDGDGESKKEKQAQEDAEKQKRENQLKKAQEQLQK